jgi:hypothetical protein
MTEKSLIILKKGNIHCILLKSPMNKKREGK